MRIFLSVLPILFSSASWAQQDTIAHPGPKDKPATPSHPVIATISLGFIDPYKNDYCLPSGYTKTNTSGYALVYAKLEYCMSQQFSIAATMGYDAFVYNYSKVYAGNNGSFTRYEADGFRLFSGGAAAYYHLARLLRVKHLDPFIGLGASLNNIRYSAYPQGDTAAAKVTHTVTPYLKAGARYYISDKVSIFADAGYDKQSVFSLGLSCRFSKKHSRYSARIDSAVIPVKIKTDAPVIHIVAENVLPVVEDTISKRYVTPVIVAPQPEQLFLKENTIQFQLDKSAITRSSYPLLNTAAKALKENPEAVLRIDGYADITGKPSVNKKISQERAEVIRRYLIKKGIDRHRLIAKGHGSRNPVASNRTKAGRIKNRRVAISLGVK